MRGTRRDDGTELADGRPGDYWLRGGRWWIVLPSGVPGNLDGWTVVEHEDRTITADPSIHDAPAGWHGYLVRGVWIRAQDMP